MRAYEKGEDYRSKMWKLFGIEKKYFGLCATVYPNLKLT
jgi:hypothetical protein